MNAERPCHQFTSRVGRALQRACLYTGALLLAFLSWMEAAPAGRGPSVPVPPGRSDPGLPGAAGQRRRTSLVCRLGDGEVLAIFQAWQADSDWRILSARSSDGGLHWTEPRVLVDSPDSEGNLALGVLRDGTVLLGYETFRIFRGKDAPPARYLAYQVMRSTDHGRS